MDYTQPNKLFDLTIHTNNGKLYFSRYLLCLYSPVFRSMLTGNFKEGSEDEITLSYSTEIVELLLRLLSAYSLDEKFVFDHGKLRGTIVSDYQLLTTFIELLHFYDLRKLMERFDTFIFSYSKKTVEMCNFVSEHNLPLCQKEVIKYLQEHFRQFSDQELQLLSYKVIKRLHKCSSGRWYKFLETLEL